jgi:hypothetical protein
MAEREQILYRVAPIRRAGADCHNWCTILDDEGRVRIIVCFSRGAIDQQRFEGYINECREHGHHLVAAVGCSVGMATATAEQRKLVPTALKGKRLAIVADNIMTRGLVTALNWLGMKIKSFNWEQFDELVHYLAVEGVPSARIREAIMELRERSGVVLDAALESTHE